MLPTAPHPFNVFIISGFGLSNCAMVADEYRGNPKQNDSLFTDGKIGTIYQVRINHGRDAGNMVEKPLMSGLEGYCKSCAAVLGMNNDQSGWTPFREELFQATEENLKSSDSKASRYWTLSPIRGVGRSNRPKEFEVAWLGKDKTGKRYEEDALKACCQSLFENYDNSMLYNLISAEGMNFDKCFHTEILPSIQLGFLKEDPLQESAVAAFSQGIDGLAQKMCEDYPPIDKNRNRPKASFRIFVKTLFAALIYGPKHPLAREHNYVDTSEDDDANEEIDYAWDTLAITQLVKGQAEVIGASLRYKSNKAVFIGRCSKESEFLARCEELFNNNPEETAHIEACEKEYFTIDNNYKRTSNVHGLLLFNGNLWCYYDLLSKNGTAFQRDGQLCKISDGMLILRPGDILYLGGVPRSTDAATHDGIATLLCSCCAD